MAKPFQTALVDGFVTLTDVHDHDRLHLLRSEGVRIDEEGYHAFIFGDHKEYELTVEPLSQDGAYQIGLYKHGITITEKLIVWEKNQA